MTTPQSPERLEPSDKGKSHRQAQRRLPVLALSAAFTLVGAGAIFATPQEVIVAHTSGSVAASNTSQLDSSVTPAILIPPVVGTLSEDDEDLFDYYGLLGFDDDEEDEEDEDEDEEDEDEDEDEEDEEDED